MNPAYRNKMDQHLHELLENRSCVHDQHGMSYDGSPPTMNMDHWRFGPAPTQHCQAEAFAAEHVGLQIWASSTASSQQEYGKPTYNSPRQYKISSTAAPPRLSLAAPRASSTRDDLRPTFNAENHFGYTENLRNGMPISRSVATYRNQEQASPITQLANNMVLQRQMPLSRAVPRLSGRLQGLNHHGIQHLQPQKQQITPPLNLSRCVRDSVPGDSSSSPVGASSPTIRVSRRRSINRPETMVSVAFDSVDSGELLGVPKTPESQMISMVHSNSTECTSQMLALGQPPPIAHGIQLVSPHELPDQFRPIFPYQVFNAAQSKCFAPVYKSDDNIVVSAPTGSGKTALLELAICRVVERHTFGQFKIVYQAPTKSLCSERVRDWQKKFSHLNLPCAELTGDTSSAEMSRVGNASIIVTTPEKWDSITRKWKDYIKLLEMVKLFLIDEVHILKDIRGATLEAVVSRMKSIGANVRFVALSATVPNSQDIAVWLSKDHTNSHLPAHREIFGESFRPVKLQKHVYGFDGKVNDFVFEKILDGKLPGLIQKHTYRKPMLVFCFTRKSCENTSVVLAEWWTRQKVCDRAWPAPNHRTVVSHKELQELVHCGVAYHHAGLDAQDRAAIEKAFLMGNISVICSTSTLAVGVNLPCHLVVLKGTVRFQDSGLSEYSDLEIMQMLGRAGRPQFDDSAIAIILTRTDKADHYKKMISGQDILESTLHLNLIEHLNSEIGLGTIRDVHSAKHWLSGTFLSVRMRQNPTYYKIDGVPESRDADERLELVCERDIKLLQQHDLVTSGERFKCTEYGEAMLRYMIQFETMKMLLGVPRHAKAEEILYIICQASEFKDLRMKPNERVALRLLNDSPFMKFPVKETVSTTVHKIFIITQVQLGGIELPSIKEFPRRQFIAEKFLIFERVQRLIRCVIDCKSFDCDAIATRHTLDLARSFAAGYWEYSSLQLRQIPQIGPVAVQKLATSDVTSIEKLVSLDTANIERILGKNPPYGKNMKDVLEKFPQLTLDASVVSRSSEKATMNRVGKLPKVNVICRLGFSNHKVPLWEGRQTYLTFIAERTDGTLLHFWRGSIKQLIKGFELNFVAEIASSDQKIRCSIGCEEVVGTVQYQLIKLDIPASEFPAKYNSLQMNRSRKQGGVAADVNEYEFSDIDDDDILAVATNADAAKTGYDTDEFADIDKLNSGDIAQHHTEDDDPEPRQMDNGKWTCNHPCSGGLTKTGLECKHRCCHEGVDKPRKTKRKASNMSREQQLKCEEKLTKKEINDSIDTKRLKFSKNSSNASIFGNSSDGIEIVDLTDDKPPTCKPRSPRKNFKQENSIRLPKQKPGFSYTSGKSPDLSMFDSEGQKGIIDTFNSDEDLPSPSALLKSGLGERPFTLAIDKGATNLPAFDESGGSMIPVEDNLKHQVANTVRLPSPRVDVSFENLCFGFEDYEDAARFSSPIIERPLRKAQPKSSDQVDPDLGQPLHEGFVQRGDEHSLGEESPKPSPSRLPKQEPFTTKFKGEADQKPLPTWLSTIDSDLVDSLKGIVDFVD